MRVRKASGGVQRPPSRSEDHDQDDTAGSADVDVPFDAETGETRARTPRQADRTEHARYTGTCYRIISMMLICDFDKLGQSKRNPIRNAT